MHEEKDNIIYEGGRQFENPVSGSIFRAAGTRVVKIEQMVTHIRRFEYIVTDSELEALCLNAI